MNNQKTAVDLDNNFILITDTAIIDPDTNIEKFVIAPSIPITNGELVTLTVDGKKRRAIIWVKARKSYSENFLPEIKTGESMTWLHLLPEGKTHRFVTAKAELS